MRSDWSSDVCSSDLNIWGYKMVIPLARAVLYTRLVFSCCNTSSPILYPHSIPSSMGRHISNDIKQVALSMSLQEGITDSAIQRHTGISVRTMKRLQQQYCNNAFPSSPSAECGQLCVLNGIQLKVCTQIRFVGLVSPTVTIQQIVAWPDLGRSGIEFLA